MNRNRRPSGETSYRSRPVNAASPTKVRYRSPNGKGYVEVAHERRHDPTSGIATSVFTFLASDATGQVREELRLRLYTAEQFVTALHANGLLARSTGCLATTNGLSTLLRSGVDRSLLGL